VIRVQGGLQGRSRYPGQVQDAAVMRLIALGVFAGAYLGLSLGRLPPFRIDRTGVAIVGAAAMVVSGALDWNSAVAAVDAPTLVLLFGMMIVAAYLRLSGFFQLVTTWAIRRARTPLGVLGAVVAAAGVLSAFFVNDVICLVLAPLVLNLTRRLGLPPVPYLIALATAANVGSVATLTGNPQNMLVGSFSGISYRSFLLRQAPVALLGLACVFAVIWLVYRRRLPPALAVAEIEPPFSVHYPLMIKTMLAVGVMLVAFLAGVPIALVAITGAAYTLLTRRVKPDKVYREIDWKLLVLFTGLFVLTGGVERTGLAGDVLSSPLAAHLERPTVLTLVAAVLSNVVSNVPAVLLFKTIVPGLAEPARAWLVLAMASTLAGNLTILGSVANLIVVEAARGAGIRIGFAEYSRVGVPLTVVTLALGCLLLSLVPV
jgi:Na+/H+ antiporter NhaD/arsenite permease-like protein